MNKEDYFKYYIQGSDHYLIPKDVFKELFNEMINWREESKILKENAENNDKVVDKVNWENMLLKKENEQLKEEKRKVRDYINKHCVNEKISKEVGYKCYTMADTNELEKIMKILGDDK